MLRTILPFSKSSRPSRLLDRGSRLQIELLEDRSMPAAFVVGSGFSTIQAALDQAAITPGADTVFVPAGIYQESLLINDSFPVILMATGLATIQSPVAVSPVSLNGTNVGAAVIDIYSQSVTLDGFIIDSSTNTDGSVFAGVRVLKGGSAKIQNNTITGILNASDPNTNIGVQIGTSRVSVADGGSGSATVRNNTIAEYKGAGVLVDGSGGSAAVSGNTIIGRGLGNSGITQYGVQVSNGATAQIRHNTISNNNIDGPVDGGSNPPSLSAGIFFFQVGSTSVIAERNRVFGNDEGIRVEESTGVSSNSITIANNDVTSNDGYAGINIATSDTVLVKNNYVFSNTSFNGIALDRSTNVVVDNNEIANNVNADGIYLFQGSASTIVGNDSYGNGFNGIFVEQGSMHTLVSNYEFGNAINGIEVFESDSIVITSNLALDNAIGSISIDSSTNVVQNDNQNGARPINHSMRGVDGAVSIFGSPAFAAGAGMNGPSDVNLYQSDGSIATTLNPFPGTFGGVRPVVADFNGDGVLDLAVGTGPGTLAEVKVIDGATGSVIFNVFPFDSFTGGVFAAAGDVNGDGNADLVITPDQTGGPRVLIYRGGDFMRVASFLGIDDPSFRGGARAALGDLNGDGAAEVVISAGFSGGPRISIFDGASLMQGLYVHPIGDFYAFDQSLRNGAFIAVGDVNGDGTNDLIFGAGPGGGPRVLILSGQTLLSQGVSAAMGAPVASIFAGDSNNRGGIRVTAKKMDGDMFADVITGSGRADGSQVTRYRGEDLALGIATVDFTLDAFPGFRGGVFVG